MTASTGDAGQSSDEANDKQKDRVWTLRVALLSASAALVGVIAGGLFSYLVAVHDSDAQASNDRADFLRQQRITAYSAYLGRQRTYQDAAPDFYKQLESTKVSLPTKSAVDKKMIGLFNQVVQSEQVLAVIASKKCDALADGLDLHQAQVGNTVETLFGDGHNEAAKLASIATTEQTYNNNQIGAIITCSRKDVGSD